MNNSNGIEVGDLVVVYKLPSCKCPQSLGLFGQVLALRHVGKASCAHCGAEREPALVAFGITEDGCGIEAYRLKKIPPIEVLDELILEEEFYDENV